MLSSSKYLIVSAFLIYTCHAFGSLHSSENCMHVNDTDISECRYGIENDVCNKPRCIPGPDEPCEKYTLGKRCAKPLRCSSCNYCTGCIGEGIDEVCSVRFNICPSKRAKLKIHTIAELLRQQEQQKQQQLQQQLRFEQEEQHQLQDLLQRQNERHTIPLTLLNEYNNGKSIISDRFTPFYPFNNNSNEIIFSN